MQLNRDLCVVGHKILVCAPSNTALGNNAGAIYQGLLREFEEKFLRLQTNGLDLASITKFEAEGDASELLRPKDQNALKTNSEYRAVLVHCVSENANGDAEALARKQKILELQAQGLAYQTAFDALNPLWKHINREVPAEITLNWRIIELMRRDEQEAQEVYDKQIADVRKDGLSMPDIAKKIFKKETELAFSRAKIRTVLWFFHEEAIGDFGIAPEDLMEEGQFDPFASCHSFRPSRTATSISLKIRTRNSNACERKGHRGFSRRPTSSLSLSTTSARKLRQAASKPTYPYSAKELKKHCLPCSFPGRRSLRFQACGCSGIMDSFCRQS